MKVHSFLSLALVLPFLALSNAAQATARDGRPVRNSFINRPVGEISDLLAHVRASRTVSDRYERHFGMDRATVLKFLGGLHRGRLQKAGIYTIYSVPQGGRLKMHVGRIRKGEPMFFNRAGQPTLVAKCGNPIVLGPARPQKGNPVAIVPKEAVATREIDLGIVRAAEGLTVAMEPMVPSIEEAVASEPAVMTGAALAFAPNTSVVPMLEVGPAGNSSSFLASLSFLSSVAAVLPHEGSPQRSVTPVPEPLSLLALTVGVGGLLRKSRRRP